jgi:hypothetical protein
LAVSKVVVDEIRPDRVAGSVTVLNRPAMQFTLAFGLSAATPD